MDNNLRTSPDCEIVSSRIVNASQKTVFKAWTDPEHLKNWWGPKGFTNTFHEFDIKQGGRWRFTMHGPEKGNYENECTFIQIKEPALVAWNRISKPLFQVVATFTKLSDQQTKITFRMIFPSPEDRDKVIRFVPEKNEENFDRLEAELLKMTT